MSDPVVPQWAYDEAARRCNKGNSKPLIVHQWQLHVSFNELAKAIAAHEEPPVNPIEAEAELILESFRGNSNQGSRDLVLTALRRGIELAKEQSS